METESIPWKFEPSDRVRANTDPELLAEIDHKIASHIRLYTGQPKEIISERIEELEGEWDIERIFESNASALALTSLLFGLMGRTRWFLVTGTVLGFLLQHAAQGWCPPIALFRRLGVRTRREIDSEKFALKYLRGDFEQLTSEKPGNLAESGA